MSDTKAVNPLEEAWVDLVSAINSGVTKGLWEAPKMHPPATTEELKLMEELLGFDMKQYKNLLLLCNGMYWSGPTVEGKYLSVIFGGIENHAEGELGSEDSIEHAFNYSGDYGRALFRRRKQIPIQMIDYDMCVVVYKTRQDVILQDDRECESQHIIASSMLSFLTTKTQEVRDYVEKHEPVAV